MKKTAIAIGTLSLLSLAASVASAAPAGTTALAMSALKSHEARLMKCLKGRPVDAAVRLRVNAHGWTDVVAVAGAEGRAATCLRVVFEELHFAKDARAAFKGEVTVPLRVESRIALRAPAKKSLVRATSQASLDEE